MTTTVSLDDALKSVLRNIERLRPDHISIFPSELGTRKNRRRPTLFLTVAAEASQFSIAAENGQATSTMYDSHSLEEIIWLAAEVEQATGCAMTYDDLIEWEISPCKLHDIGEFLEDPRRIKAYEIRGGGAAWVEAQRKLVELLAKTTSAHGRMMLRAEAEAAMRPSFILP